MEEFGSVALEALEKDLALQIKRKMEEFGSVALEALEKDLALQIKRHAAWVRC